MRIFGSCSTGLALADSDIDIAINSLILNCFCYPYLCVRDRIILALDSIQNIVINQKSIISIKLIKTASIPILKLVKYFYILGSRSLYIFLDV